MKETKVINLFGGPGIGKSRTAARLFSLMKDKGMSVELVREYAKELVWAKRFGCLEDQFLVSATQNHRQRELIGEVDYIITDSPIILGILYGKEDDYFNRYLLNLFGSYSNRNFFLHRRQGFDPEGRIQDEKESRELDKEILDLLREHSIPYTLAGSADRILDSILFDF